MAESPSMDKGSGPQRLPVHMNQPIFPPQGFPGPQGRDWEALQTWVEELVAYKVKEAFQTLQLQGRPEGTRSASSPKEKTLEASTRDGPEKALSIDLGEHPSSSHQEKTATVSDPQKLSEEGMQGSSLYPSELSPKLQHGNQPDEVGTSENEWESSASSSPEQEMPPGIPLPESFVKLIKREWAKPAKDRKVDVPVSKLYLLSRKYEKWLNKPLVDAPVAALNSFPVLPPTLYLPKATFDRRMEAASLKAYNAASYALRASAANSLFARANYVWLQDLLAQPDIPSQVKDKLTDILHATAFIADASLDSLQFSARAMGAAVVVRRNTWLRHWDADEASKAELAEAPFKGGMLFGDSLESFLVETKRKKTLRTRKQAKHNGLLPNGNRRGDKQARQSHKTRYKPYP